jgi:Rod binding domain-containing protein
MKADALKHSLVAIQSGANESNQVQNLRKVCADFEAIFISKMLQTMRKANGESSLFGDGMGAQIYQSLFDNKIAESVAHGGGMGIGDILFRELSQNIEDGQIDQSPSTSLRKALHPGGRPALDSAFARVQNYHHIIQRASDKYKVPLNLIYGVIAQESSGNPDVVSRAGAKGLMQLMDETAADLGVRNSFDPEENINGGVRYLKTQLNRFKGNLKLALAAYNAGPSAVTKYGGIPPYAETQDYVRKVINYAEQFKERLE